MKASADSFISRFSPTLPRGTRCSVSQARSVASIVRRPNRLRVKPIAERDASRLMVLDRVTGGLEHRRFRDLPELLRPGDLLVTNRSRVFKARLVGRRPGGGRAELLLVRRRPDGLWDAMLRPGRRLRAGTTIEIAPGFCAQVEPSAPPAPRRSSAASPDAEAARDAAILRPVRLLAEGVDLDTALARHGHTPLPPYIRREDRADDRERYQTVYAREPGSIAAPTAGLHFTPELLARLDARGVERAELVLHVGPGTFQPLDHDVLEENRLHAEAFTIDASTLASIAAARSEKRRIVAVGTTVTRVLETAAARGWLRLWVLRLDGRAVATEYQLEEGGRVYALRAEFDGSLPEELSPGTHLNAEIVRALFARPGVHEYDMGPGENEYKSRWTPDGHETVGLRIYRPGAYGAALYALEARAVPAIRKLRNEGNPA